MSKPTLCVIVPVYKAAATLDRCVASVLAQQVAGGLHCILVDDGSPDESGGLCDAWAARDPRVTVLHQENRGVSAARNAGLTAADSEYLVFLDADDALRPGALQAALDAQNTAPQSFVLWHYTTDEQDAAAVTSDTATRPQNMLARLWLDCLLAMPWNKLYRTASAQQLTFDRQYTLGEDLQFVLDYIDLLGRTAPDFAYTILTAPLTFYDCSLEGTLSTKYHADYCKIWPEHFARLNKACYAAHCPQEDMRPLHRAELTVYAEGVKYAILMAVRVMALIAGTSLLTYTTSPIVLTDAIEQLLKPLGRLHFPVHELAMMMSIALRFIPTLIEETDKIMNAQKARGAMLDSGTMTERIKALVPVLIPLFISAFRRADELAMAMECRCYRGGDGRTRLKVLRCTRQDYIDLAVCIVCFMVILSSRLVFPNF